MEPQHHHNQRPGTVRRRCRRAFTLIEMLIAMSILACLMLVLFKFFGNVQTAWSTSINTTELYENARVVLDVITRDLQSAVARANDIPGQHIRFRQEDANSLWFVTAGNPSAAANSSLVEVGYRLSNDQFERAFVDDTNAAWNIYGARDDADDQDGYQKVIDCVLEQEFVCYDATMTEYMPDTLNEETNLPTMISIILTLMDARSYELRGRLPPAQRQDLEQQTSRTFRKTVYLGMQTP